MDKIKNEFRGRHFTADVILWAVRWYLQFPISYRDLERMLADRGVSVDQTTVARWTQRYAPEIEKRVRPHLRMTNGSCVNAGAKMRRLAGAKIHRQEGPELGAFSSGIRLGSDYPPRRQHWRGVNGAYFD